MRQNVHKDIYRFAFDEASSELRKILQSFEQLCAKKNQVEKLLEVLKPEIDLTEEADTKEADTKPNIQRTTHLPQCIVVTRLRVL
jgi:hypothetical protein